MTLISDLPLAVNERIFSYIYQGNFLRVCKKWNGYDEFFFKNVIKQWVAHKIIRNHKIKKLSLDQENEGMKVWAKHIVTSFQQEAMYNPRSKEKLAEIDKKFQNSLSPMYLKKVKQLVKAENYLLFFEGCTSAEGLLQLGLKEQLRRWKSLDAKAAIKEIRVWIKNHQESLKTCRRLDLFYDVNQKAKIKIPRTFTKFLPNLVWLDCYGNRFADEPIRFLSITSVRFVKNHLDPSMLSTLLSKLHHVKNLTIRNNFIESLPDSLTRMTSLISLDFSENSMKMIPPVILAITSLRQLILTGNNLLEFPSCLTGLTNLAHIDLENNQFNELPEHLTQLCSLRHLNVSHNFLDHIPQWYEDSTAPDAENRFRLTCEPQKTTMLTYL